MKTLIALGLFSFVTSCLAAPSGAMKTKVPAKSITAKKEPNALDKKPADCDEKAKKPVEITPESISLSGTTGCSLDEAKP
jgi:hypothetical protein